MLTSVIEVLTEMETDGLNTEEDRRLDDVTAEVVVQLWGVVESLVVVLSDVSDE